MTKLSLSANISSLKAQRQLGRISEQLSGTYNRLSSGLRINSASDDPAGLAVSEELRADTRVFTQAVRNANDAVSLLNTADGALQELEGILTRLSELATQAANGTFTLAQRKALDEEAYQLTSEYNRIVSATDFNEIDVLDRDNRSLSVQVGYGTDGSITFDLGEEFDRLVGTGEFSGTGFGTGDSDRFKTADLNGDGNIDVIHGDIDNGDVFVQLGNGDGTFQSRITLSTGGQPFEVDVGDLDGDGDIDIAVATRTGQRIDVLMNNGNGTFANAVTYATGSIVSLELGDLDGDGSLDIVVGGNGGEIMSFLNSGTGTFSAAASLDNSGQTYVSLGDVNGDGILDVVANQDASTNVHVNLGNGDGTFQTGTIVTASSNGREVAARDVNHDGYADIVLATQVGVDVMLSNGDGTFASPVNYGGEDYQQIRVADVNGDGIEDIAAADSGTGNLAIYFGNGDGTFSDTAVTSALLGGNTGFTLADFNNDGVLDTVSDNTATGTFSVFIGSSESVSTMPRLNLHTADNAREAAQVAEQTLNRVLQERAEIGANQSRLDSAISTLFGSISGYTEAFSRILDADIAQETADLTRLQVQQQATTAVLAQANQTPSLIIQLLT